MYKDIKKHQAYANDYISNKYDRFNVTMPKGTKVLLQQHSKKHGDKSVTALIVRAIRAQIIQDGGDVAEWNALAPDRAED